jgi:hypothetical protein
MCPSQADASAYIMTTCGGQVLSEGTFKEGQCCYSVYHNGCGVGRPFLVGGQALAAAPRRGNASEGRAPAAANADQGWIDASASMPLPSLDGLSPGDRARLAEAWARDGLFEHASIASFGRFALELMAAGAPADLIELAHRAALDEVRHAKLCLTLAGAYAGEAIEPSRFPFNGRVDITDDLADLAARATDPAVRAVLAAIAEDEARHAELAWRAVAWACRTGGARVKSAVAEAIEIAIREVSIANQAESASDLLEAHGLLTEATRRSIAERAVIDVIRPSANALLATASPGVDAALVAQNA